MDTAHQRQLPGYWTVEELATEAKLSTQSILHAITGFRSKPATLLAKRQGGRWLITDADAQAFLENRSTQGE